jgi:hypothetical protein
VLIDEEEYGEGGIPVGKVKNILFKMPFLQITSWDSPILSFNNFMRILSSTVNSYFVKFENVIMFLFTSLF